MTARPTNGTKLKEIFNPGCHHRSKSAKYLSIAVAYGISELYSTEALAPFLTAHIYRSSIPVRKSCISVAYYHGTT
jgi:hypothetical protein